MRRPLPVPPDSLTCAPAPAQGLAIPSPHGPSWPYQPGIVQSFLARQNDRMGAISPDIWRLCQPYRRLPTKILNSDVRSVQQMTCARTSHGIMTGFTSTMVKAGGAWIGCGSGQ